MPARRQFPDDVGADKSRRTCDKTIHWFKRDLLRSAGANLLTTFREANNSFRELTCGGLGEAHRGRQPAWRERV